MDSSQSTDRIDIVKLIVILVLLVVLIGAAMASGFSSSRQQAEELPEKSAEPAGTLEQPTEGETGTAATAGATAVGMAPTQPGLEGVPALPASDEELTYNPSDESLSTADGETVYVLSEDGTTWIPVVPPEVAGEVDNPVPMVDANGVWVLVDSDGMVQYQWDEATLTWEKVEMAYLPTLPEEGQPGSGGVPALPASDEELTYNPTDGSLSTADGETVYVLSEDGTTWIPVVPPDLAGEMNNPVPAVDANGEWLGVWVLVDSEGMAQYQWDEATLTWEKVEVAYLPTLPEEAQPTEQLAAPSTETPAATPAGEASATTASAEAAAVEIPASLLSVPKTYSVHPGEFPFCLARRFDVNPMELLYFNGLNENSVVISYTKLRIPTSGRDFPPPRALLDHPDTYTVKAGDTIYTIACKYGDVYPEAIVYANQLSAPFRLQAGQSLYIP